MLFEAKILQKEIIFFISEGIFLAIFTYLIFNNADSLSEIGNYFHNVNVALFTILIPLAIAVLSDYFKNKRNNEKISYAELDLIVIINSVFDVKLILITVLLSYLPSFFWSGSSFGVRNLLLIIWLVGVGILVRIILDFILWIKDPYYHRFKFLKKIRESDEYISAWASVWKAKENNKNNELKFFEIFSQNIDYLIKNNRTDTFFNGLLGVFSNQIKNREKDILLYWGKSSPLEKILEWYYEAINLDKKNTAGIPFDYEVYSILEYVEIQSLDKSYGRYLKLVESHINKHLDDVEYVENFFSSFLSILLSNLDKISSELMFWKSYPEEWKIKSDNLESGKIVPLITLREVIIWSENRISDNVSAGATYDSGLNKVFYNLFSETESISWANIWTFLFFPYTENKMQDIVETKRFFGGIGRISVGWGEGIVETKAEMQYKNGLEENKKLLKFVYRMISDVFPSIGYIKDYQGILFALESEYKDDRYKLVRIKEFQAVLKVIEDFVKELEKNKSVIDKK